MRALAIIPERDRRRVISAASLMTSATDGEALAAVRATCRLLEPHGVGPADLIAEALKPQRVEPLQRSYERSFQDIRTPVSAHQRQAQMCLSMGGHLECLNDWERGFLTSIKAERSLTQRQQDKLAAIVKKIDAKVKEQSNAAYS